MTDTGTMRNFEEWQRTLRNFEGWLDGAVPGAMDVDFFCERNGNFLVIESKPWRKGVVVPYGQHKALYALSKVEKFRVYLAGEDGDVVHLARVDTAPKPKYLRKSNEVLWTPDTFIPSTHKELRKLVAAWWKDAADE